MHHRHLVSRRTALRLAGGAGGWPPALRARQARWPISVSDEFYAEPSQGGFFQAAATGLYDKAGVAVEIKQGGPQINGMQL